MEWKKEYEVGEALIDKQHKELINIINRFNSSISDEAINSYREIGPTIKYLIDYTSYHFDYEETIMSRVKYPGIQEHQESHKKIILKITEILKKFKLKQSYTPIEFYYFLSNWLNNHILIEDMEYKKCIKKSNLEDSILKSEDYSTSYAIEVIEPNFKKIDQLMENSIIDKGDVIPRKLSFISNFFNNFSMDNSRVKDGIKITIQELVDRELLREEDLKKLDFNRLGE